MPALRHLLLLVLPLVPTGVAAAEPRRLMTVEDLWALARPGAPSLSPDGKWAVIELTRYSMADNDSTSDLWLLATDGSSQRQLTSHKAKDSSPAWSPDGKHIAFVSRREGDAAQIYLISPEGGEARPLTAMPMSPSGLKWAPNSKTIYCIAWTWPDTPDDDSHKKKEKTLKESKVQAYVIDSAQWRYWDTWLADGRRPMLFAVDVETGKHRNLFAGSRFALPPTQPNASFFDISPDSQEIAFVADSAKDPGTDTNLDVYVMPLESAEKARNLTADNPASDTNPLFSPDGKSLAFLRQTIKHFYADRQRIMVLNRATGQATEVTDKLDRSCVSPHWRRDGRCIYFLAEDQGHMRLWRVELGTREITPLTAGATDSAYAMTPDGQLVVLVRSTFDKPPAVHVLSVEHNNPVKIERFNEELVASWRLGKVKEIWIKGADDREVQTWLVFPPDFDEKRKWPLLHFVHGGPHGAVLNDFHFRWNLQLFAARGYVVAGVNFHGSSGFGQAFTDSITGDVGRKPMIDILKATDYLESLPYIDKSRTCCAGASYGGYMMAWLNGHTDRFKCMICHAGVYNWHSMMASDFLRGRDRALGVPPWGGGLEQIDKQSPQRLAANFKTPTLILHGERDFRVPVTQGFEYYNTLRQKGVPCRLVWFPDENHWILKPQNSRLWHQEVFAWLERYAAGGPRP